MTWYLLLYNLCSQVLTQANGSVTASPIDYALIDGEDTSSISTTASSVLVTDPIDADTAAVDLARVREILQVMQSLIADILDATNANLTGPIISNGNQTAVASQTGTGSKFVMDTAPTINQPILVGVTDGSSAAAGDVGEFISSQVTSASPVSITSSDVAQNITNISLSAGTWDISAVATMVPAAGTVISYGQLSISGSSATNGPEVAMIDIQGTPANPTINPAAVTPTVRVNISVTTTEYLVLRAGFSVSTLSAYGTLRATRIR